jgi:hypothetical protein
MANMLYRHDNGKKITTVPYNRDFQAILKKLGPKRANDIRQNLNKIIDEYPKDTKGMRHFNTSWLGSKLGSWREHGIGAIYDVAKEILGLPDDNPLIEERAALIFGQFIIDCLINRNDDWFQYRPNIDHNDQNHEVIGKSYFDRPAT